MNAPELLERPSGKPQKAPKVTIKSKDTERLPQMRQETKEETRSNPI